MAKKTTRPASQGTKTAKPKEPKGKGGRPAFAPSELRTKELVIPLTAGELQEIRAKASASRLAMATWARSTLLGK